MTPTETDLRDALTPLREARADEAEVARALAAAPAATHRTSRRMVHTAGLLAATAAGIVALAALPSADRVGPADAHGILSAAAAAAAEQPAPAPYRFTRVQERVTYRVTAGAEAGRVTYLQTSENWTSQGFAGRTSAPGGNATWDAPPSGALRAAAAGAEAVVKPYDGPFRFGDGPLARVPFAALPTDPAALERFLREGIADLRWTPDGRGTPRWAPGAVDAEVIRSAVTLLALGNLSGDQRRALFELLGARPGARALGTVTDAAGRRGTGVALPLPGRGGEIRVVVDPSTSDILQSTEGFPAPPPPPAGTRRLPWPPPVALAQRTEVFLASGGVGAVGARP